jgi:hypothetical protein
LRQNHNGIWVEYCTYCMEEGRAANLTPIYEKGKPELKRQYCPKHIGLIVKDADPWIIIGKRGELLKEIK